ncbi:MAG: YfhO family protein [Thermogutta sp.]
MFAPRINDIPHFWHGDSSGLPARCGDRRDCLAANTTIAASVGILCLMALPALFGHIYTKDDLGAYHLPLRYFYSQQWTAGESFDWHPGLFGGFYLSGEGQLGAYHPWHLWLYRFLPVPAAFSAELLSNYAVLWGGIFLLVLRLTRDRGAAAWAGLIFTFGGFSLLRFVHPNAVAVVAHLPWLLWCEDRLLEEAARSSLWHRRHGTAKRNTAWQRLRGPWLGYAALTGSQWLMGYPQYVWYSLLAEAAWFVVWSAAFIRRRSRRRRRLGRFLPLSVSLLILAQAWGAALGAVQLLPTLDSLRDSARAAPTPEFLASGSLHPANGFQLVAPYLFQKRVLGGNTHEMGLYFGAVPLILALAGWTSVPKQGRERLILLASAAGAILSMSMAVGRYSPLFAFQQMLPFRCPSRAIVLFQLCVAIAAAYGFRHLLRLSQPAANPSGAERAAWLRVVAATAAVSVLVAVLRFLAPRWLDLPWGDGQGAATGPLLFLAAALAIAAAAYGHRIALMGMIVLTTADLATYGLSYAVWRQTEPISVWRSRAAVPPLPDAADPAGAGRIVFLPDTASVAAPIPAIGNESLVRGFRRIDGYAGLPPRRVLDMQSLSARRIAGVSWVGRFQPSSNGQVTVVWEDSPDPLPRFRTVNQVVISSAAPEVVEGLDSHQAVVEKPVDVSPEANARLRVLEDRPGRMAIAVRTSGPVLLVVSEAYHSGWQAAVDGRATEVLRVNGDFMGCLLPAGGHRVVWTFRPRSLIWGRRVSLCALTLLAAALLAAARRAGCDASTLTTCSLSYLP